MQRRDFLQSSSIGAVIALAAAQRLQAQAATAGQVRGLVVRSGHDRLEQPFRFLDGEFRVLVSGRDTNGGFVIFDTHRSLKNGPALHLHTDCDEWFMVLEGTFKFRLGDEMVTAGPGDALLAPKGVPHAFVKTGDDAARMLVMHQPAGTMEEYFRTGAARPGITPDERRVLAERHGMKILGGPLSPD